MSRNSDRTGFEGVPDDGGTPFSLTDSKFEFAIPTEIVELPSKGKFYSQNHPLFNQETVEIRYMTTRQEDILTSKTFAQNKVTIDKLISSLLLDNRINPETLLTGDRNAIIIAARITGFGEEYTATIPCEACGALGEHQFNLSDSRVPVYLENEVMEKLKCSMTSNQTLLTKGIKTGCDIEMRLLTGKDETYLAKLFENKEKQKLGESFSSDTLTRIIVSVAGSQDQGHIRKYIESAPLQEVRVLRQVYDACKPDIKLKSTVGCTKCGHESVVEVPLTTEFFWPKR